MHRASCDVAIWSRWWELNPTTPVWRTGVSPQHFTCLVVSEETEVARHRGRRAARPMSLRGSGGNRTHVLRCKRPLQQPTFATDPFVSPSGIEPEPPGLQPGAQTTYARVRCDAARARSPSGVCSWVPARAPFIVINSSVVRDRHPRHEAHLGRLRPSARAGRTSGGDAFAILANAPIEYS